MRLLLLFAAALLYIACAQQDADYNKQIELVILKNYNSRHRPVKKDSTTTQVQVYMTITNVENVDEYEQTMQVHGHLFCTWVDEYLTWDPKSFNNTDKIQIDPWRVWQPALALYNSARRNSWHIHMNAMPAVVSSTGRVFSNGAFSYAVTCQFDFSQWPNDEQECPIVLADWVYDLSRVNLSDPYLDEFEGKPMVKLNYDPLNNQVKKHIAGWEISDTWRKHCYWGPLGCAEELPDGQAEWYWSLLEFGVKLKRHAPYFVLTVTLPTVICCMLTLASFWVDTLSISVSLLIFNILLQGLFGWELIRELPPGSGSVPKIVTLYGFNLSMTTIAFILHVLIQYFEMVLPDDFEIPLKLSSLPKTLRLEQLFRAKGLSFDPQILLNPDIVYENSKDYNSSLTTVNNPLAETTEETTTPSNGDTLINMENGHETYVSLSSEIQSTSQTGEDNLDSHSVQLTKVMEQMFTMRRFVFLVFSIFYALTLTYCLIL